MQRVEAFGHAISNHLVAYGKAGLAGRPMLIVAGELATDCALAPEVDAMSGEKKFSKAVQTERIIERLPERRTGGGGRGPGHPSSRLSSRPA